ncbi:MAG: membrane protein of unknown function [Promethearchaeota archaeon]|nr:MAG: membrane protein of unknown function [Candidatus Lokiarchaeota archaeon]
MENNKVRNLSCPQCGKGIEYPDQKFCRHCGTNVKSIVKGDRSPEPNDVKELNPRYSRISFTLAIISAVLGSLSIIIGIITFVNIDSSVYRQFSSNDYTYLYMVIEGTGIFIPEPDYVLGEAFKLASYLFGIIFLTFSIIGALLGIVAIIIGILSKKHTSSNKLRKISLILAIMSIILSIIGCIIAGLLLYYPRYIIELNRSISKYAGL